ncbi:hypothetical protein E4K72_05540 [Oxalobacteraceae bacterium OM1]|nr:hypothetical protein E4K72_05540 [Oxalobacteraceae bacterium OM1]
MLKKILAMAFAVGAATTAHATLMTMPTAVQGYPALTAKQMSVAKAYLAVFGRAPDLGGLNYWSAPGNGLADTATVAQAVNYIAKAMATSNLSPVNLVTDANGNFTSGLAATCDMSSTVTGWDEFVEYMYVYILGKAGVEDMSGLNYWQCQVRSGVFTTPGDLVNAMLAAADGTAPAAGGDKFHNKMTMLEAAARLQLGRNRALDYQDTQTVIRRVTDTANSFNDAFARLDNLTNGGTSAVGPRWETPASGAYAPSKVLGESNALAGGGYVHKYVVWYNRSGRMLLAHVFLPPGYSTTGYYPAIVSVHGGAWRAGFIEKLQKYNTAFTQNSGAGKYVVFAPAYALTAYGYASPEQQNDIDDFISLVKSPATMNAFRVDTANVNYFGVSAGGHLLNLIGSTKDLGKVATLYPVSDLASGANTATLLPYISLYLNGNAAAGVSPTSLWSASRSTKFFVQHGTADTLVPFTQSSAFTSKAGPTNSALCGVTNADHGFYAEYSAANTGVFSQAAAKVLSFFDTGAFPNCSY